MLNAPEAQNMYRRFAKDFLDEALETNTDLLRTPKSFANHHMMTL